MSQNTYQVLGARIPQMLGRERLLQQVEGRIFKPEPDNIQIVGPRHYGKSVFLNHLAAKYRRGGPQGFVATAYDDLRHTPPSSDADFKRRFAVTVKNALATCRPDIAELIEPEKERVHELLDLALSELDDNGERLLMIWDGFDNILIGTRLTPNLLGQLRALTQRKSLRLVTGSRRPLRELCRTKESLDSNFWEVFNDLLPIGRLGEHDWDGFLKPIEESGRTLDSSARKEIANWSGGIPLLASALLLLLSETTAQGANLSKPDVDQAAEGMLDARRDLLTALWEDCSTELQSDLGSLAERGEFPISELPALRQRALEERGFAEPSGSRIRSSCRLMLAYARGHSAGISGMKQLFGTAERFDANVRSWLEIRLAQLVKGDAKLREYIRNAIRDIAPNPEMALTWVRSISDRALELIWRAELPLDQAIPKEWLDEWKHADDLKWLEPGHRMPRSSGKRCKALRQATGTDRFRRVTKYVTKTTSLLVDQLQSVGDFGQHRSDYPESSVSMGFAAQAIFAAIELFVALEEELQSGVMASEQAGMVSKDSKVSRT